MKWLTTVVAVSLIAGTSSSGWADEIVFRNGDRLTGRFVSLDAGTIRFESTVLGALEIDAAKVQTFATDEKIEIHTAEGTIVQAAAQPAEEGSFDTEVATFRISETPAINPPEPDPWSGRVFVGFDVDRGNTHKQEADLDFEVVRTSEVQRITVRGEYEGDRVKDTTTRDTDTTKRTYKGVLKYDRFLTEKLYWFAATGGERDGIADLDLRFLATGGLGYDWIKTSKTKLFTELGPSWTSEHYEDSSLDDDFWGAFVRWGLERELRKNLTFFHKGQWRPSVEESDVQLIETETGWRVDIRSGLFFETKVNWDWDSEPAAGKDRQDVEYVFGLGYGF